MGEVLSKSYIVANAATLKIINYTATIMYVIRYLSLDLSIGLYSKITHGFKEQ